MNIDNIDLSIGLAASLELLEMYREDGILYADVPRIAGSRTPCRAWIHLVQGKVVSCSLEEENGQSRSIDKKTLSRLDAERGPFAWTLLPPLQQALDTTDTPLPASATSPVPKPIAPLNLQRISQWSAREKILLRAVFTLIDGKRSVEELKAHLSLSSETVDKMLRVLLSMEIIIMSESTYYERN